MSLGAVAGLVAAIAFVALVALSAVPLLKLGRVLEEVRLAVRDIGHESVPILTELRGTLEEILAEGEEHGGDWVKAVVTDTARPAHLQERLREAFPELLLTEYAPEGREQGAAAPVVRREADPLEVMDQFLTDTTGGAPSPAEHDVLEQAYAHVRREQAAS